MNLKRCQNCDIEFMYSKDSQICCTELCLEEFQKKNNPRNPVRSNCKYCTQSFIPVPLSEKYCSDECRYADARHQGECINCKKKFIKIKKEDRFCSRKCKRNFHERESLLIKQLDGKSPKSKIDSLTIAEYDEESLELEIVNCKKQLLDEIDAIRESKKKVSRLIDRSEYMNTILKIKKLTRMQNNV